MTIMSITVSNSANGRVAGKCALDVITEEHLSALRRNDFTIQVRVENRDGSNPYTIEYVAKERPTPPRPDDYTERFERLKSNDATVRAVYRRMMMEDLSEIDALRIALLTIAEQRDTMASEAAKLRAIAPRRIKGADGSVYRWDAPDEFVEVEQVRQSE